MSDNTAMAALLQEWLLGFRIRSSTTSSRSRRASARSRVLEPVWACLSTPQDQLEDSWVVPDCVRDDDFSGQEAFSADT